MCLFPFPVPVESACRDKCVHTPNLGKRELVVVNRAVYPRPNTARHGLRGPCTNRLLFPKHRSPPAPASGDPNVSSIAQSVAPF